MNSETLKHFSTQQLIYELFEAIVLRDSLYIYLVLRNIENERLKDRN